MFASTGTRASRPPSLDGGDSAGRRMVCIKPKETQRTMKPVKKRMLTPGPTAVPEETMLEMARPVFYHRSAEFRQLLAEVLEDLQYVFQTRSTVIPLTSSGTGGLE